jgi:hypothetical protein
MSSVDVQNKRKEYTAKLILISVFLGGLAFFIFWMTAFGPGLEAFQLSAMQLVLLSLATYRLGRLIAYDRVMEPLRQAFTETLPDPTGSGETVEAKGQGFQLSLGQLICCPICAGTWVAAGLVYLLYLFPAPVMVFLTMTAVVGAAEMLNAATESMSWSGQYYRTMSGSEMINRDKQTQLHSSIHRADTTAQVQYSDTRIEQVEEPEFFFRR